MGRKNKNKNKNIELNIGMGEVKYGVKTETMRGVYVLSWQESEEMFTIFEIVI